MIELKHCKGCRDNFYNPNCWSRETGRMVKRLSIGMQEMPPYKNKELVEVPDRWHGSGNQRQIMVKPEALDSNGYWKH